MPIDPDVLVKLDELLAAIRAYDDPRRAATEWKQTFNLLKKTDAETNRVANVVAMRGVDRLAELIDELRASDEPTPDESDTPAADAPDDTTCKMALRAFKKRLKLTRLDDESQINSRNPMSSGAESRIASMVPPNDWPEEVWRELARRGKLRHTGRGFYELTGK